MLAVSRDGVGDMVERQRGRNIGLAVAGFVESTVLVAEALRQIRNS